MKLLEGADIWHVDASGSVSFRIAVSSYRRLREKLAHCVEVGNVEDIVRESERLIVKRSGNDMLPAQVNESMDWFDEYVSLIA